MEFLEEIERNVLDLNKENWLLRMSIFFFNTPNITSLLIHLFHTDVSQTIAKILRKPVLN